MKKVVFTSRHEIQHSQKDELDTLYGEVAIETRNLTFKTVDDLKAVAMEGDVVAVVAVMPQWLSLKVGCLGGMNLNLEPVGVEGLPEPDSLWAEKILTSESEPMPAVEGEARKFRHVRFLDCRGEAILESLIVVGTKV